MNYRQFIIAGVLGVFALIAVMVVYNFSAGPPDSEFVYKGDAHRFEAAKLAMDVRQGGALVAKELKNKGLEVTGTVLVLQKPAVVVEEDGIWCFFPESAWPKIEKKV